MPTTIDGMGSGRDPRGPSPISDDSTNSEDDPVALQANVLDADPLGDIGAQSPKP